MKTDTEEYKQQDEAISLVNRYGKIVYPYAGSGFLSGHEDDNVKFEGGKKQALYFADRMMNIEIPYTECRISNNFWYDHKIYWSTVKNILTDLKFEDANWEFATQN